MVSFHRQHVRLATGTADREAELVYADGELLMVLQHLADWSHGHLQGRWLVKTAFGPCSSGPPGTFATIDQAEDWARHRLAERSG